MMIHSSTKNYEVKIEEDFSFAESMLTMDHALFVIDSKVYELYYEKLFQSLKKESVFVLDAVETNKTIEMALEICEIMTNIPAKRNAVLISFGGGIVQDVTGFVANVLYRGIKWLYVPTTLLAACDSCIGGKTSLNYKKFKNLLGTFYPPDEIYICPQFFKTLSERDFQSGLGEVVKFNVMFGEEGIAKMEDNISLLLQREEAKLNEFVKNSLLFKKDFIEQDEFDKGIRINLNFAHTFGHAFETMSNYAIPHGTAVAMGTIVANRISLGRGWLAQELVTRVETILWQIIHVDTTQFSVDMEQIISAIRKDKKQVSTDLTAVLMKDDMKLITVHDVKPNEIEPAISYLFEKLD